MGRHVGVVRGIDDLGRIVVPKEMRKVLNVNQYDSFDISLVDDYITIKKYEPCCIFCKESTDVVTYKGYNVCKECFNKAQKQFEID
jgi:transcriptional pleiotropic regulator of transition state genes